MKSEEYKQKAGVVFPSPSAHNTPFIVEARLQEATGLAEAIELDVIYSEYFKIREIKPSTYLGEGVIEILLKKIEELELDLLVFDTNLSPIQQRNLEKRLEIKVIDRTALILEIFGERATTKEGVLQVELAHLTYQRSRLVRSWTHLERQRGGAGFLGGPGETQIELDRRLIDDQIVKIKKELEKVKKTRDLQRGSRKKVPYPIVALVGYTNAGKSSIFNKLSNADVFAKDLLFATLDPTMRKITLPSGQDVILSDTVGFISSLPHELIMSFRATLEEVLEADIVVHVRDISGEHSELQKADVLSVLHNLGLDEIEVKDNYIELLNKVDIASDEAKTNAINTAEIKENYIVTSALTGSGLKDFLQLVDDKLSIAYARVEVEVNCSDGKLIAWIHENSIVVSEVIKEDVLVMNIKIDDVNLSRLANKTPLKIIK